VRLRSPGATCAAPPDVLRRRCWTRGRTRLELAALEFEEARARATDNLVLVLVAAAAFGFALLAASMLVVVLFWDSYRIAALVAMTLVYLVIGLFALWRVSEHKRTEPPAFAATLAELERDRAYLASRFSESGRDG
jgi:uncharacterized membrane protein YqjE